MHSLLRAQFNQQNEAQNTAGWDYMGTAVLTIQQCLTTTG